MQEVGGWEALPENDLPWPDAELCCVISYLAEKSMCFLWLAASPLHRANVAEGMPELANTMLDIAIETLADDEHPIVHTDRGGHYRWPGWIERMERAHLTRSMSKKGCSPGNATCEGFHGRLKNEFFYNRDWRDVTVKEFIDRLDVYLHWYSEERIKISLGGMSPIEYRKFLGLCG